jgi:hypothetical protein
MGFRLDGEMGGASDFLPPLKAALSQPSAAQ